MSFSVRGSERGIDDRAAPAEAPGLIVRASRRRPFLAIALLFLSVATTICALVAAPKAPRAGEVWRGYSTVLVSAEIPESDVLAAFGSCGLKTVISLSTEPVVVSNWVKTETTTLGALHERLVQGDPRRDSYIESLEAWFSATVGGTPYRAYYLPSGSALFQEAVIERSLSAYAGRYVLPDKAETRHDTTNSRAATLIIVLLFLVAASLLGPATDHRSNKMISMSKFAARLSLAAPWVFLAAAGIPTAAVAALWGLALVDLCGWFDMSLDEFRNSGSLSSAFDILRRSPPPSPALGLGAAASLVIEPRTLASVALALAASLSALSAYAGFTRKAHGTRSKFVPRPIVTAHRVGGPPRLWNAILACAVVFIWIASAFMPAGEAALLPDSLALPFPSVIAGSLKPGPEEARARIRDSTEVRIGDLAYWLEHIAGQEAFPLERVGQARKDPFASVEVSRPGGTAASLAFDDEWARAAYKTIPQASVEGMLVAQGTAVVAEKRKAGGKGRPLAPIDALRYIFLLIPPLGRIAAGLSAARGPSSSETGQEA
jgi:hypothetical protein